MLQWVRWRLAVLLAVVILAGIGCGTGDSGSGAPASTGTPKKLDFTATTLDGKKFDGTTLAGKPAVLWFWALWCPTCGAQAPHVADLAEEYQGEVTFVGVAGLDDKPQMRKFVARTGVDGFTHLADDSGTVWKRFGITAQSTYVLLDAKGAVVQSGYLEDDELSKRVAKLARSR